MANSDKNILITPNISQTADPKIEFSGADATTAAQTITLNVYPTDSGTLSFEGSAGQLFSITNNLSGSIFSVNDVSGIPSLEVLSTGEVKIAQYSGPVLIGTDTSNGTDKLQIAGSVLATAMTATTFNGALAGNASTATTLQTARTIGGVSFNGSADINLPGVNTAGNQNTTGSAATLTTARTIGGVSFNGSANINLPGVNTAGNQNTTGSAATLTTARAINGVNFNGSAAITVEPYVERDDTTNAARYLTFVDDATAAHKRLNMNVNLSFNPSTNVLSTTATSARYADLAEKYTSDSDYAPGTVVIFGGIAEVTISNNSHDTAVAGIVSTNPAYLMNSDEIGVAVALTGKVPCQVMGPVRKGTVLVTGHLPGVAQALDFEKFAPGCILGKAMESIDYETVQTINVAVGRF